MSRQKPNESEGAPLRESTIFLSSRYRRSPFFEATQRHGCEAFGVYNHMLMPSSYGADRVEEYWHLLEDVTLWDVAVERVIEVTGEDALAFADRLTPRDLTSCSVGQGRYTPLTADDGGIVNDPVMLRVAEDRFWFCLADSDAGLWMRGLAAESSLEVEINEPDAYPVQVQGPKSKPLIDDLFGPEIRDLDYYWCAETDLDGIPVLVSRTGWSGEVGYEVFLLDYGAGDEMWERIMEAGEQYDIQPTPPSEIRRIEAGIFNYGSDMTIENNPLQLTGMERLVEFEKSGDFVGRSELERIAAAGVDRKLVGVEFEENIDTRITEHWSALYDGTEVGTVTAATWSPRLRKGLGYAWIPVELNEVGTTFVLETNTGTTTEASVTTLPFYDPEKEVPRS